MLCYRDVNFALVVKPQVGRGVTARGKKLKSSNLTASSLDWNVASRNANPQLTERGRRIGLDYKYITNFLTKGA